MSQRENWAAGDTLTWLLEEAGILEVLARPNLTDFYINGTGEGKCFADCGDGCEQFTLPLSTRELHQIAHYAAVFTNQRVSEREPLCITSLPGGERFQIVLPPAVGADCISYSIRKPKEHTPTRAELRAAGVFDATVDARQAAGSTDLGVQQLIDAGDFDGAIHTVISNGLNFVLAGDKGSGKTHVARAYTDSVPQGKRVITIEDMAEMINLRHANVVHLFYSKGNQSVANVTAGALVEATARMGTAYVMNQELRDEAACPYLDGLEAGGNGGMTTTHARRAAETRYRIKGLIQKHPDGKARTSHEILHSLNRAIDLIAFCEKQSDGKRRVVELLYGPQSIADQLQAGEKTA